MIELRDEDARVALEICDLMTGPMTDERLLSVIRMASYLTPKLEDAFEESGIDVEDVVLIETPPLRPGDLAQ